METQEIWRDIPGYENLYQASTFGNIRSLNYGKTLGKIKQLIGCINNGYYRLGLYNNNYKNKTIHSLIMLAFKGVRPKGYYINHIDGNKLNNELENLEYCTPGYNLSHAIKLGLATNNRTGKFGKYNPASKSVSQYNLQGILLKEWNSITEIQNSLGILNQNIGCCCRGTQKTAGGFMWKYT